MTASVALERGRAAYADRRWQLAYDELTAADREAGLPAEDIARLSARYHARRERTALAVCGDCPSTQVAGKFAL